MISKDEALQMARDMGLSFNEGSDLNHAIRLAQAAYQRGLAEGYARGLEDAAKVCREEAKKWERKSLFGYVAVLVEDVVPRILALGSKQ